MKNGVIHVDGGRRVDVVRRPAVDEKCGSQLARLVKPEFVNTLKLEAAKLLRGLFAAIFVKSSCRLLQEKFAFHEGYESSVAPRPALAPKAPWPIVI